MKQSIINSICKSNTLKTIIANIAKDSTDDDLQDLEQDIYLELLTKDEETIENLFYSGQLNYYLTRMVINNINSKTSRYYYRYKKNKAKNIPLDEWKETADSD